MKPFIPVKGLAKFNALKIELDKHIDENVFDIYNFEVFRILPFKKFRLYLLKYGVGPNKAITYLTGKRINIFIGDLKDSYYKGKVERIRPFAFDYLAQFRIYVDLINDKVKIMQESISKLNKVSLDLREGFQVIARLPNKYKYVTELIRNYATTDLNDIMFYVYYMSYENFSFEGDVVLLGALLSKSDFVIIYPLEFYYRVDILSNFDNITFVEGSKDLFNKIYNNLRYYEFKMFEPNEIYDVLIVIPLGANKYKILNKQTRAYVIVEVL